METTTDKVTEEEINAWLKLMREPVDSAFVANVLRKWSGFDPTWHNVEEYAADLGYTYSLGVFEGVPDSYTWKEMEEEFEWANRRLDLAKLLVDNAIDAAGLASAAMSHLRSSPSGNFVGPRPEEYAWMTQKERDLVEWFDHGEYAVFMHLCPSLDPDEGWIVPCYFSLCVRFDKGFQGYPSPKLKSVLYGADLIDKVKAAADQGNGRAQNILGVFCERGLYGHPAIIDRDIKAARDLYRRSAEAGCTSGKLNYARALEYGIGGEINLEEAERVNRELSAWGHGTADFALARTAFKRRAKNEPFNLAAFAEDLLRAAQRGDENAVAVVSAAQGDLTPDRLLVEYHIRDKQLEAKRMQRLGPGENVSFSVFRRDGASKDDKKAEQDRKWVASKQPAGVVVPPASGRETVRTPNLTSENPSFAARLIIFVRDRFGGDAPAVYNAAHINRKTYSSIISNELRPVSKQTAISLALGLRLTFAEAERFIKAAGFAFSMFILEDIIVEACIKAGIYDISRVNEILAAHGAKTFPAAESDHQLEEQK